MSAKRIFKDFQLQSLPSGVLTIWYTRDKEFDEIPSAPLPEFTSIEDQIHAKFLIEKIAPKINKRLWNFFYKRYALGLMASEIAQEEGLSTGYVQCQINRAERYLRNRCLALVEQEVNSKKYFYHRLYGKDAKKKLKDFYDIH